MRRRAAGLVALAAWVGFGAVARAESGSVSPYIDELRQGMLEEGKTSGEPTRTDANPDPYIQSLKAKGMKEDPSTNYSEELKRELGPDTSSESYTDKLKQELGPDRSEGAIEALKAGHSELHEKRVGEIHNAAGFRIGASLTPDITAASHLQSFNTVYGGNYPLDLAMFYEYQPWHSEWFGNIGFFGQAELGFFHGHGIYQFAIHNADGGSFAGASGTNFQFYTVPVTVGVNYRFNLFRLVRPFAMVGGTYVGMYEGRDDGGDSHTAGSRGIYMAGGANILLDWMSKDASWNLYVEHGVKHYYLTLDYSRIQALSGDVSADVSGFYAGFTFEF